jgi:hypothetical protein
MRLLICGGRDFRDRDFLNAALAEFRNVVSAVITGGAPGADSLAFDWAHENGFALERYMADWQTHGRAAGPIRNQRMLDEGKPDVVDAFAGGRGTADMVRRAKEAGVQVNEVGSLNPTPLMAGRTGDAQ